VSEQPVRPVARIVQAPPYEPDLEAHGLKLEGDQVVAIENCPDLTAAKIFADSRCQVDARLWEGRFERGRLRESQVTDRLTKEGLEQRYTKLRESLKLTEGFDSFALGSYGDPNLYGSGESGLTSNYVPLIPGPATRQQYWADYWQSSAKCFEASTHSGIAKRACRAMVQFPLGRGVRWRIESDTALQAWEAFWKGNRMRRRMRSIGYDLSVFGEQFLRYFPAARNDPKLLIVRQLDPATIYEIVTDQEDLETVFFYHQQFQTRIELYSPPRSNRAPQGPTEPGVTRYVIRQIDASEIDHWRVNDVSGEARGRSDLFPALGDLKRLRDLLTSKVIQSDIGNRVMAVLKANGTPADITRILNTIFPNGQPPAPGTIVGLNEAADLEPFQYTSGREVRADFTYDELVDGLAAGVGLPRSWLGLSPAQGSGTTQATALTSVQPGVKTVEERQDILDELLHQMFDRVMEAAGVNEEVEREFIFPEIAKEDTSKKLEDLEMMVGNGWISGKTAATAAAAESGLTDYDYDEELKLIIAEFAYADETDGKDDLGQDKPAQGGKLRRPVIRATSRQEPRLDPTKAQSDDDEPLGMAIGPDGKVIQPAAAGGNGNGARPATKNPAARTNKIAKQTREASKNRRHPEDPQFTEHASEFDVQTAKNLERLLAEITT
jgi:hypothetical protein